MSISSAISDPDALDSLTATVDWGDGVVERSPGVAGPHGGSHVYVDEGSGAYTVTVAVTDSLGLSAGDSLTVFVANDAPNFTSFGIFDSAGNPTIDFIAGDTATFSGAFTDAGSTDAHTLTIDWGDGIVDTVPLPLGARSFSTGHVYLDPPASGDRFSARVTIDDGDGGTDTLAGPVRVDSGIGVNTVGLVDTGQGQWHLIMPDGGVTSFYFGNPFDVPVVGDWNCDGIETPGLFRLSDAFFYLRDSNDQGVATRRFFAGDPNDVPLAGDFDGDGCGEVALYRPSTQQFFIFFELGANEGGLGAANVTFGFGNPGDTPVVGDWDGDGADEIGLYRESTGFFYYRNSLTTGVADGQFFFGNPLDKFVAGDWIATGSDAPGVYRPGDGRFYLKYALVEGNADAAFPFGNPWWVPVAGVFGAS